MDDKKFEDILDEWMSYEIQKAPELRPREEMYRKIEGKKRVREWFAFPRFLRWSAAGAAAAVIILMIVFYPGQDRSTIGLRKGASIEPKRGEKRGPKKGPAIFEALLLQYQKKGESRVKDIDFQALRDEKVFLSSEDNFRFIFQVRQESYIYIYMKDSRQILTRLFPNDKYSQEQNPVHIGKLFYLPSVPNWLYSKNKIEERKIYVFSSSSPKLTWDKLYEQYFLQKGRRKKRELATRLLDEFAAAEKGLVENTEVHVLTFLKE
jgi:hypothetical protein